MAYYTNYTLLTRQIASLSYRQLLWPHHTGSLLVSLSGKSIKVSLLFQKESSVTAYYAHIQESLLINTGMVEW